MITYYLKKWHKTKLLYLFMLSLAVILFFCFHKSQINPAINPKLVDFFTVKKQSIQQTVNFIGTIKSGQATVLFSKSKGILAHSIKAGTKVKKGTLIARIINSDVDRGYQLTQEGEEIARLQFDRFNQLLKTGTVSKSAVEEKKTAWLEYRKKLAEVKNNFEDLNIYAPFEGVVGIFKVNEGAQVRDGESIVTLYDPEKLIVEFDLPLDIASKAKEHNLIYVQGNPYPLTQLQRILDEDTHMCPAYAEIECPQCIIGSTVAVKFVVSERKNVLVVPFETVILQDGKPFVFGLKDKKAVLTPVQLGIREKSLIEISSGLKEGDTIIIHNLGSLYPEMPVQVAEVSQENDKKSAA